MTIGEVMAPMQTMDPTHDVVVAFFEPDGTGEMFDIDAVQDHHGDAQLDVDAEAGHCQVNWEAPQKLPLGQYGGHR